MWMWYGERKISVIFGGGQRSSEITRGQTLKTFFIPYRKMCYGARKKRIVFGGGQRSFGVTRGQSLKTLFTQYLKVGSLDRFHTKYVDVLWCEEKPYCFLWRSQAI
ncbi:hypothetical protein HOLleu_24772 [Holothuria leucospilota]|uniref:Uncharacterized protein n=1 Tax=Holothuria leucospilota TaxID=206669 RepID=A0A9Q1BRJ1_HOLLE|nr:hypothetical protein HOLleu_24772 [Holothuria leucospilota]